MLHIHITDIRNQIVPLKGALAGKTHLSLHCCLSDLFFLSMHARWFQIIKTTRTTSCRQLLQKRLVHEKVSELLAKRPTSKHGSFAFCVMHISRGCVTARLP